MATYAQNTSVPSDRTRVEIEKTLERYGATTFSYARQADRAMVLFVMNGRQIRFTMSLPTASDFTRTPTGRSRTRDAAATEASKAERQRWRALLLIVKAKLEAVESGIVTFEEEFLAHTLLPSGNTVYEDLNDRITDAYLQGNVSPLQIGRASE